MQADFLVADLEAAMAYNAFRRGEGSRPILADVFETGNLTGVEITTLWAILEQIEWNADRHFVPELLSDGEGDSWLHELPPDLVRLLNGLDQTAVQDTARNWAATEELMCSPSDLLPGLNELSRLARKATEVKKGLFLWGAV